MIDKERVKYLTRELLIAIGENPDREGLRDTPRRVAGFWSEFIDRDAGNIEVTFSSVTSDQMVVITGMRVWSLCEHHLLPFYSDISIAYIAKDCVLGLSKFARIAHKIASRLQIQERLVSEIADEVMRIVDCPDVAVLAQGVHLCMVMRGVKTHATMKTSVVRGRFRDIPAARQEFLELCSLGEPSL